MSRWTAIRLILFAILFALVGSVLTFPIVANREPGVAKSICLSNLKQLSTAFSLYAEDQDGYLPRSTWVDETFPYHKAHASMTCPSIKFQKLEWGYAMNWETLGKDLSAFPLPIPLLFEIDALAKDVVANPQARSLTRHEARDKMGSMVLKTDTSARFVLATRVP